MRSRLANLPLFPATRLLACVLVVFVVRMLACLHDEFLQNPDRPELALMSSGRSVNQLVTFAGFRPALTETACFFCIK